jgi:deoxycytidine triphosphate deaminase
MIHLASSNSNSSYSILRKEDIQPNAIDLRIDKVFRIMGNKIFKLDEDTKEHRDTMPYKATIPKAYGLEESPDGYFDMAPGHYEVIMEGTIHMAEGEAGFIIPRSTLNRNGVFMTTGLYDSGYNGVMASVMHVTCGDFVVKRGTRVAQFLLFKAESLHMYDGDYGLDKLHDDKYHHLQEGWD